MADPYTELLAEARIDLAFALAQGDGVAEDEAAARIAALEELRQSEAEFEVAS